MHFFDAILHLILAHTTNKLRRLLHRDATWPLGCAVVCDVVTPSVNSNMCKGSWILPSVRFKANRFGKSMSLFTWCHWMPDSHLGEELGVLTPEVNPLEGRNV